MTEQAHLPRHGMKQKTAFIMVAIATMVLSVACHNTTIYNDYQHTHLKGWKKNNRLNFHVPPMQDAATCQQYIGIRLTDLYPFQTLSLIIQQTIYPENETLSDTLNFEVIDEQGQLRGNGLNISQMELPFRSVTLKEGDSIHVTIQHNMRRDILEGISDIGLRIETKE